MLSPETSSTQAILTLSRVFHAPIAEVFDAWTNTKVLANWFGPEGYSVKAAEIDLKVGGQYLIVLQSPEGELIEHFGAYVEITPPTKLVFTWILKNQTCRGSVNQCVDTLVTLDFKPTDQSTEIQLRHERLPNKEAYDGHQFGWIGSFECLNTFFVG